MIALRRGSWAAGLFAALLILALPALALAPENTGLAQGDGIADDTAALQSVLDRGETVVLGHGKTYRVTHRLDIRHDGTGLIGDGTATLLMASGPGAFDNTDYKQRHVANAVGISANGIDAPRVEGLRIVLEKSAADRVVKAISIRSSRNMAVRDNDISGFSRALGIIYVGASEGGSISGNLIHDSRIEEPAFGQLTGILTDDDDASSCCFTISGNTIRDLTVSAAFLKANGVQTDGINTTVRSRDLAITGNRISQVGEGVDTWSVGGRISGNAIWDAQNYGIKMMHGATGIRVEGNVITRSGKGGIVLAGSGHAARDTADNVIVGNTIITVNAARLNDRTATFGIGMVGSKLDKRKVTGTLIADNVIDAGPAAAFAIFAEGGIAAGNVVKGNRATGGRIAVYQLDRQSVPAGVQ